MKLFKPVARLLCAISCAASASKYRVSAEIDAASGLVGAPNPSLTPGIVGSVSVEGAFDLGLSVVPADAPVAQLVLAAFPALYQQSWEGKSWPGGGQVLLSKMAAYVAGHFRDVPTGTS